MARVGSEELYGDSHVHGWERVHAATEAGVAGYQNQYSAMATDRRFDRYDITYGLWNNEGAGRTLIQSPHHRSADMAALMRVIEAIGAIIGTLWILANFFTLARSWRANHKGSASLRILAVLITVLGVS